jgi:hypothetical protein
MSDLKRCREAFDERYPGDFDKWTKFKWKIFKAGWAAARRADDDNIDRQTIIDIINRHEYQLSDGFGYYGESSQAVCDIADEILEAMRPPLPDPPRKDDGHEITDEEGGGVR